MRAGVYVSLTAIAAAASHGTGCVGEAIVTYQGTVSEAAAPGHSFDDRPNPTGATPIAGATVELSVDGRRGPSAITAGDGSFTELSQTFGGFAGGETSLTVRATSPDGRVVEYDVIYEETGDPTIANPSCERPCAPAYLNLQVGPLLR